MEFDYQITIEDYVSAQWLYAKLRYLRLYLLWPLAMYVLTLSIFATAWIDDFATPSANLLIFLGSWSFFVAVYNTFPKYRFRRSYKKTRFAGNRYRATITEEGVQTIGKFGSHSVAWLAIDVWGEDRNTFILVSNRTVFIFGKLYLNDEEQLQLR